MQLGLYQQDLLRRRLPPGGAQRLLLARDPRELTLSTRRKTEPDERRSLSDAYTWLELHGFVLNDGTNLAWSTKGLAYRRQLRRDKVHHLVKYEDFPLFRPVRHTPRRTPLARRAAHKKLHPDAAAPSIPKGSGVRARKKTDLTSSQGKTHAH